VRLFDTSVVIDCRDQSSAWNDWATHQVAEAVGNDGAGFNAVALAEAGVRAVHPASLAPDLEGIGFTLLPLPVASAALAAKAYAVYLQRCKAQGVARVSQMPLPDFLIGAHAEAENLPLVTRDPDRVKTYFPNVQLIVPSI
jgi:hypothetical protein